MSTVNEFEAWTMNHKDVKLEASCVGLELAGALVVWPLQV